jgi:hypothetical protein
MRRRMARGRIVFPGRTSDFFVSQCANVKTWARLVNPSPVYKKWVGSAPIRFCRCRNEYVRGSND